MAKYGKRGKYLPILHETTRITNLSINACWNQIWLTYYKQTQNPQAPTLPGNISKHSIVLYFQISIQILYSFYLFYIRWPFLIDLFSKVLFLILDQF